MIDLHIHSSASDGSDSVPELVLNLQKAGIYTFAVTDHDTMDGAVEMEKILSAKAGKAGSAGSPPASGFYYIKGIEFSCITPLRKCHILGYGCDPGDPQFAAAIREGNDLRFAKLERRLSYLQNIYHIEFTSDELAWLRRQKSPGKPHIADLLLKRGIGKSRDDLIRNYIRETKETKKAADRLSAATAISAILHAGGIPVWAHPLGGEGEKLLSANEFEEQLLCLIQAGIRGLECHYSRYNREQVRFLRAAADKHHLLISGGSDYHGSRKNIALGTLNAYNIPVYEEQLTILQEL